MKILSVEQLRDADAFTIQHEPIASIDLMERAAKACSYWLRKNEKQYQSFKIFCGVGNNGADGLALANMLVDSEIVMINYSHKRSANFLVNFQRSKKNEIPIKEINSVQDLEIIIDKKTIIIDCIFGTGLNKPAEGLSADAIKFINNSGCEVISIDVPSGLSCDDLPKEKSEIVKANHTLTFQCPKLSFMFPSSGKYCGNIHVLDIGLDKKFVQEKTSKNYFITKEDIKKIYSPREKFSHKGTYGHALIVAGSYGKAGASVLSAKACLRAGAGLVTVHVPKCNYQIIQTALPEAMTEVDANETYIGHDIKIDNYNAIAIGPGIGILDATQDILKVLIQNTHVPLVIDADAINILSENKTWLAFLPAGSILTPHPKEFERLCGKTTDEMERYQLQKSFSVKHNVYVVLKGAHTCISTPEGEMHFNSTGNAGMATAGSGDALTGIITALLAQGYSSFESCLMGVYLHGLSGDIAAEKFTQEAMIASDIIDCLAEAFKKIGD